jgi:small subunit ribosomal protein S23
VIIETDGKDYQRIDWSKGLRQPGIPLSGESVVQRMLYRIEVEGMTQEKAYDVTRREFYRLRQEEEIARRVTLEEARHVGAYFGLDRRDVGMKLENNEFENWKTWAAKQIELRASAKDDLLENNGAEDEDDRGAPPLETEAAEGTPEQVPQGV